MGRGGGGARVAAAAEDAEIVIGQRRTKEEMMRRVVPAGTAGTDVDENSSGGKGIGPEPWGHIRVEQKGANIIVESAEDAFNTTVLLRGVGTR
jgi:hypothetical protein